jgi:hypothetical protein
MHAGFALSIVIDHFGIDATRLPAELIVVPIVFWILLRMPYFTLRKAHDTPEL